MSAVPAGSGVAEIAADLRSGGPALRELVQAIAAAREDDRADPAPALAVVRASRLGALRVPRAQGGGGATLRELLAAIVDVAEVDPDVAHILRNHFGFVEERLLATRPGAQDPWLRRVTDGALFGMATTEAGPRPVGDDRAYATSVTTEGAVLRLRGTKQFVTGARFADHVAVLAMRGPQEIVHAVVPTDRAGVELRDDWDGIGQRHTGSGTAEFHDVRLAPDEVLPGWRLDLEAPATYEPTLAQLWLHAVIAGILRAVVTDAVSLVRSRPRTFSHAPTPVAADDPLLHQVVGELSATQYATQALVLAAADALDVAAASGGLGGRPDREAVRDAAAAAARVKIHVDETALRAAGLLFEAGGASATKTERRLDRHWRNIRTLVSHNPSRYKAQALGALLVSGRALPTNGYF
ncbi:acyl-CoA dehydrogenase family protein [Patulibacter sp. NPDC049589]|uniref:acyl-CoA dehydrogenase family protein n=1 Tax=Patulibacter sp. NPDC049589 TaxID=3154731 RepID=UPI0034261419